MSVELLQLDKLSIEEKASEEPKQEIIQKSTECIFSTSLTCLFQQLYLENFNIDIINKTVPKISEHWKTSFLSILADKEVAQNWIECMQSIYALPEDYTPVLEIRRRVYKFSPSNGRSLMEDGKRSDLITLKGQWTYRQVTWFILSLMRENKLSGFFIIADKLIVVFD